MRPSKSQADECGLKHSVRTLMKSSNCSFSFDVPIKRGKLLYKT